MLMILKENDSCCSQKFFLIFCFSYLFLFAQMRLKKDWISLFLKQVCYICWRLTWWREDRLSFCVILCFLFKFMHEDEKNITKLEDLSVLRFSRLLRHAFASLIRVRFRLYINFVFLRTWKSKAMNDRQRTIVVNDRNIVNDIRTKHMNCIDDDW